jgi:hypothetical protein
MGIPGQEMGPPIMLSPMPGAMPMMPTHPMAPTSQVSFQYPESLVIHWDKTAPGRYDSEPCVVPATYDFAQANIYRLKVSNIPGRPGKELYPTLEIAPTKARTQAFLAHNSIPIEFAPEDFDQVLDSGNFITKVIYLPNPEYQGLAMYGVGTLSNVQLEPGADPIVEASNRGAILAIIRMGNKDLKTSSAQAAEQRAMMPFGGMPMPPMMSPPMVQGGFPVNGSSIPQNAISGVNIPPYGVPMTKTSMGVPGPPQLPQGMHATNRYPIVRTEPIPAPPTQRAYMPVGVDPPHVMVNPHYMTQMQMMEAQQAQPAK